MIQVQETVQTWAILHQRIHRPTNEADYLKLLEFMQELTDRYDINLEPHSSLFQLVSGYLLEWERENEPPVPPSQPFELLRFMMEQHKLSQNQLAKEGIITQSALSKILRGERGIGKKLAAKLATRFKLPAHFFW
jgi:HTH-type transcriptional regulator / antitoxin HigA